MQAFGTFLGMIFGLALLVALLFGGYFLFEYVAGLFGVLESQVGAIVTIVSIVVVFCTMILAGGLKARSQKQDSASIVIEKISIYEKLLTLWRERLNGLANEKQLVADSELVNLELQLALHGSSKVIMAYMDLRRLTKQEEQPDDEIPSLLNKLAVEMREDLGRTALNLKDNDLVDLLLGRN